MFYCASVSLCELVSSSYGGAGRGRHQDLIPGEACRERHSSGDSITPLRMNPAIAPFLSNISGSILVTLYRIQKLNLIIEAGFIPVAPKGNNSEGVVVDRCLWACGSCEILTNTATWTRVLWIPLEACLCAVNNWEFLLGFFFFKGLCFPLCRISQFFMFFLLCPQFVPFRDYMDRTGNHVLSMARLAKDVLAEIPDQFISYMKSRGIKPNPAPPPYTPPGHTHHHTQIWGRPLGVWLRTNSVQLPRSPAGTLCLLFLRWKRESTHQEVIVEFPASAKQHSEQLIVSLFSCVDLSVFSRREDANYPGVMGKSLLLDTTRQWLFDLAAGRLTEVMLWFKLVPVCDCFSDYIRTREDRLELTRSSLWPIPSGIICQSSPSRISFYIWDYCQDVIEDQRLIR